MATTHGAAAVRSAITTANGQGRPAFVAYLTAGFPSPADTVPLLLALQRGGADIIELGIPFSDPLADGPVIQYSNQTALSHGIRYADCLNLVSDARAAGLTVPVILMGYINPLLAYGEVESVKHAKERGADGFIVVDLPVEEAGDFIKLCKSEHLAYVPLAALTTKIERLRRITAVAESFIYCVSVTGVTGSRAVVNNELPEFLARIRDSCGDRHIPLGVGFGISNREQFLQVASLAEAVVMGSALIRLITEWTQDEKNTDKVELYDKIAMFAAEICGRKL